MPSGFAHYYRSFFSVALKGAFRVGKVHMVGVLLAVVILLFQIHYRVIPSTLTVQALLSLLWPYGLLAVAILLVSVIRAPVLLDMERQAQMGRLAEENEKLRDDMKRHQEEIKQLNSPPEVDPLIARHVSEAWTDLKLAEKEAVKLLVTFEDGLTCQQAIRKLNQKGLALNHLHIFQVISDKTGFVQKADHQSDFTADYTGRWAIVPKFREAIKSHLQAE